MRGVDYRNITTEINGYSCKPLATVQAARRVLAGERLAGFATPARVFGGGLAESIEGTQITDF